MAFLKKLKVDLRTFDVHVSEEGEFYVDLDDGDRVDAHTLGALETKLRAKARQKHAKLAIPVTLAVDNWKSPDRLIVRDLVITGWHSRHNSPLVRYEDDNTTDQLAGSDGTLLRRLTDSEAAELVALWNAKQAAEQAFEAKLEGWQVSALDLVTNAVGEETKKKT
jgi:hypothetical protein